MQFTKLTKNLLIKLFLCLAILSTVSCVNNVPTELNGKILMDENGNKIKLKWHDGWGHMWTFLVPVEHVVNGDTIIIWVNYPVGKK